MVVAVPVAFTIGFAPEPNFLKIIRLFALPEAVNSGGFSLKICPALTLKINGLVRVLVPKTFALVIASVKLLKLVPPVGNKLLMVKVPPAAVITGISDTNEMLSIMAGGLDPPELSDFHAKINLNVVPAKEPGNKSVAV